MDYETKKRCLESYVTIRNEAENIVDRLAHLESEAIMPPPKMGDGSKHTGGISDRMGRATVRLMEQKEIYEPQLKECKRKMRAIERAVSALSDPLERSVLRLRYLYCDNSRLTKWPVVAAAIYGDDDDKDIRAAHRLHREAVENINLDELEGFKQ